MTKEEHIQYWLESAQHDLESAEGIFDSKIRENYAWFKSLLK